MCKIHVVHMFLPCIRHSLECHSCDGIGLIPFFFLNTLVRLCSNDVVSWEVSTATQASLALAFGLAAVCSQSASIDRTNVGPRHLRSSFALSSFFRPT